MATSKAEIHQLKVEATEQVLGLVNDLRPGPLMRCGMVGATLALILPYTWVSVSFKSLKTFLKLLIRLDASALLVPGYYAYTVADLTLFYCWLALRVAKERT